MFCLLCCVYVVFCVFCCLCFCLFVQCVFEACDLRLCLSFAWYVGCACRVVSVVASCFFLSIILLVFGISG